MLNNVKMIKTMDKIARLQEMFEYAKKKGICKTKQEFSKHIGIANSNLSHAFNGDTRYLNDNLLKRVNESLDNAFSLEWLMYGNGEMYANNNNVQAQAPAPTQAPTHVHARGIRPSFDDDDIEYLRHRIKELEYVIELQRCRIEQLEKGRASARAN